MSATGCAKPIQKRYKVLNRIEIDDVASGPRYADDSKNLDFIQKECNNLGFARSSTIDWLLSKKVKIISTSEFKIPVVKIKKYRKMSNFGRSNYIEYDLKIAGNCIGKEYIVEGDKKIFENMYK